MLRCWIRLGSHDVELRPGRTLIGRHESCQVVLADPLASRRHALLNFDGSTVSVEDLNSSNGVLVNGKRADGARALKSGDRLQFGSQVIVVHLGQRTSRGGKRRSSSVRTLPKPEPTQPRAAPLAREEATLTQTSDPLDVLTHVADKALALGRGLEAERLLRGTLLALLREPGGVQPAQLESAATSALRLAETTGNSTWLNYVIELYEANGVLVAPSVIERLYGLVRAGSILDVALMRRYTSGLRARPGQKGSTERLLLTRLEELSHLLRPA